MALTDEDKSLITEIIRKEFRDVLKPIVATEFSRVPFDTHRPPVADQCCDGCD